MKIKMVFLRNVGVSYDWEHVAESEEECIVAAYDEYERCAVLTTGTMPTLVEFHLFDDSGKFLGEFYL